MTIDAGKGYRLLEYGEILKNTDEVWHPVERVWGLTKCVGRKVGTGATNCTYRRKLEEAEAQDAEATIDPGPGYRLLSPGELLREQDEYWRPQELIWTKTDCPNTTVGETIKYRRKLEEPARKKIYIAGPMRGKPAYNFPEFDRVANILRNRGFEVFNPADLDRNAGFDPSQLPSDHDWSKVPESFDCRAAFLRDMQAIAQCTHITMLDDWEKSIGATCEYHAAKWLGLQFTVIRGDFVFELSPGWEPVNPTHAAAADWSAKGRNSAEDVDQGRRESVLEEAQRITGGDRQAQYGPPDQDFRRTAAMWTGLFGDLLRPGAAFEPFHIALAMILLKASRQMHRRNRDNWVDMAGYSKCGNQCDEEQKKREPAVHQAVAIE